MGESARVHVVLPKELLDAIDALVGKRKRSEFIARELERQVHRLRQIRALNELAEFNEEEPGAGAPEWATAESAREWVRAGRRLESGRERRIRESWSEPPGGAQEAV